MRSEGFRSEKAQERAGRSGMRADDADIEAVRLDGLALTGSSAFIHSALARRLAEACGRGAGSYAGLVHGVADVLGVDSAAVTLRSGHEHIASAVSSDERARHVQDTEMVLGEGPSRQAIDTGTGTAAASDEMRERWPRFAEAVASHRIGSIAAVPLMSAGTAVGSLTVLDRQDPDGSVDLGLLTAMGEALMECLLEELVDDAGPDDTHDVPSGDTMPVVNRAVGMVAARRRCAVGDSLALIKGHAFAEDVSLTAVALAVTEGRLDLTD